ncbi:MAG: DUF2141 domain-containing protein [Pseudomonadota bacterium]
MVLNRCFFAVSIGLWASVSHAGDVIVEVRNLRSDVGVLRVAICPETSFTDPSCPWVGSAPASENMVTVRGVPDGIYAVQAFHDEDGDGDLDRRGFRPSEGLGFSNDARIRFGPPKFEEAAIRIQGDGRLTINMRYFQ